MGLFTFLLLLLISGAVVGGLARLALPGPDPMGFFQTVLLGVAGSFVAGLLVAAVTGGRYGAGFIASVAVTTGLVYLVRRSRGGRLGKPVGPRGELVRRR